MSPQRPAELLKLRSALPPNSEPRTSAKGTEGEASVQLGVADDGSPVFWEPERLPNGHLLVVAGTGEGKTQTTKLLIVRRIACGPRLKTHVFDSHGEYRDVLGVLSRGRRRCETLLVDTVRTGLPFRLLEDLDIPKDIRVENILADLRASAPQLGHVQAEAVRAALHQGLGLGWETSSFGSA